MSRRLVDGKQPVPGPNARKGGRPKDSSPILTKDIQEEIAKLLRMGSHVEVAAAVNGIGYDTLRLWVVKGKEDPASIYGAFNKAVQQAIAQAETRDLSLIDQTSFGRPAEYEMEVVRNPDGTVIMTKDRNGDPVPLMQVARNKDGNAILKRAEIRPNWNATAWKMARRNPKRWGNMLDQPSVLDANPEQPKEAERDAISPEQKQQKLLEFKEMAEALKATDG